MTKKHTPELTKLELKAVRFAITALTDYGWLERERREDLPYNK